MDNFQILCCDRNNEGSIYQPPNQSNFLQTLNGNFTQLDTLKNELDI